MNIDSYRILISNLPVRQQCFATKRTTWLKAESEIDWLKKCNDNLFDGGSALTISRKDIFDTTDSKSKVIKIIYWGYPRGMRGKHFINILKQIDLIESTLTSLIRKNNSTVENFSALITTFKTIRGLGLSTYSKLLYFFQLSFNENPCLILDQRLINVFANKTYFEFEQLSGMRYGNAERKYLAFLELTNQLAKTLDVKGENIEQFLFLFGNNLKGKKPYITPNTV